MPSRRVIDWQIKPGENDTETLYLRSRPVLQDANPADIHKYLRKHRQPGQSVHRVAEDGYIADVTRQIERRQPRRRSQPAKRRPVVRMPLMRF